MQDHPISVVLTDDHLVLLEGLQSLLMAADDIQVVGTAATGAESLRIIKQEVPQVAVVDLGMPDMSGFQLLNLITQGSLPTRVVLLSAHEDRSLVKKAMEVGASGYVLKRSAFDNLLQAIRSTSSGGFYLDPNMADRLVKSAPAMSRHCTIVGKPTEAPSLTNRECDVLRLIALGYSTKEVGGKLGIGLRSVDTAKIRASRKLRLGGRPQIVQYAVRHGWLYDTSA